LKENIEINQLVEHFFRHESGKMVSVLTKIFGSQNLDLAEDVVQDSLIEAISQWQYKGVSDNPSKNVLVAGNEHFSYLVHCEGIRFVS
jgi:predicted RNA polymerase sigma factor